MIFCILTNTNPFVFTIIGYMPIVYMDFPTYNTVEAIKVGFSIDPHKSQLDRT